MCLSVLKENLETSDRADAGAVGDQDWGMDIGYDFIFTLSVENMIS